MGTTRPAFNHTIRRPAKNDAWLQARCAAINLRTLLRHGLARSGGAWILA